MKESKILHLDMNSYFAAMEQQAYPNLRGKPIGVAGKGKSERTVIVGASIEAKKFGITSGTPGWEALKLCPQLIIIPADYSRYVYTSRKIFSLLERFSPTVEVFSIDEAFIDLGNACSWEDALQIAKQIKQLIRTQVGEWMSCSVGISYGRTLAKLGSELQKPDGLVLIRPEDFAEIAERTPIEKLCGIGWRLRPRLNQLGVTTIAQLGRLPKSTLVSVFGDHTGNWLHSIGNGIESRRLRSFHDLPQEKSISHAYTLPRDITHTADVRRVLLLLSERVGVRLRKKGLMARSVSVYLRFGDRTGWATRSTGKEYFLDGYRIYQLALKQLEKIPSQKSIRLVSVAVTELCRQTEIAQPLFPESRQAERVVLAMDRINHKYGELTVYRGSLLGVKQKIFNLPDGRNHRLYVPKISEINPFLKRF